MTKETLKELLPIFQAWIDGKKIQSAGRASGFSDWSDCDEFAPDMYAFDGSLKFRVKPEPKLRAWTIDDKPDIVGHLIDVWTADQTKPSLVLAIEYGGVSVAGPGRIDVVSFRELCKTGKVSRDHGKTWHPCGVEE